MSDVVSGAQEYQLAGDDVVVPFAVEELDIRGRVIQTGDLVDTILKRHDYPQDVSLLLGELIVLTILLGSSLKFEGNFILQTQSDGPVSLAVVDFVTPGTVRASSVGARNRSWRSPVGSQQNRHRRALRASVRRSVA